MIYHIYWGTSGNAGLYTDEIYQSLNKAGYKQKVFVSYYYPFDYGEKVFFKRTEMEHCRYKGVARKVLQGIELIVAFLKILNSAWKDKPQIVNYSYVSSGNVAILFFLRKLKHISGCQLVFTCHDVVPFSKDEHEYNKELDIKKKIYAIADAYLVHNENSKNDLLRLFSVDNRNIYMHPFPLMDLSKLDTEPNKITTQFDYLIIGHMRREKGIDLLLETWFRFHEQYPGARLCIAGNPNYYKDYLDECRNQCKNNNVVLKLGFIKDKEYVSLVKSARCVVFPYTAGTNSGVISTVVSLNRDVITSDIGMFADNSFVPKDNMFKAGDRDSLLEKLIAYQKGELVSDSEKRIEKYRTTFNKQVKEVYSLLSMNRL